MIDGALCGAVSRHIGRGIFDLKYTLMLHQAKRADICFSNFLGFEGVQSSSRYVLRSFAPARTYRVCGRSYRSTTVRQQRLNSTRSVTVSHPKHDLWVFGRAITPPGLSHPLPPSPTVTHPQPYPVGGRTCYHTPWGPPRPALYHRGYIRYHTR